jgi:hypothetical protein
MTKDITETITREGHKWFKCEGCSTRFLRFVSSDSQTTCDGCLGVLKSFVGRSSPHGTSGIDGDTDMFGYTTYIADHLDIGKGFDDE